MDMCVPHDINIPDDYSYFKALSKSPNLDDTEAYQYEYRRLASFATWPDGREIDLFNAAKTGLFYEGFGNRVGCFCCGLRFVASNPRIDPVDVHKEKSLNCPLLSNTDALNKPLWVSDDEGSDVDDSIADGDLEDSDLLYTQATTAVPEVDTAAAAGYNQTTGISLSSLPQIAPPEVPEAPMALSITPAANTKTTALTPSTPLSVKSPQDSLPSSIPDSLPQSVQDAVMNQGAHYGTPTGSPHLKRDQVRMAPGDSQPVGDARVPSGPQVPPGAMFLEEFRLRTFATWPPSANMPAAELARLGFFYLGQMDKTQCAFCHRVLMKWEAGDNIAAEHRKYSPECPFVNGVDERNIPLRQQPPQLQPQQAAVPTPQAANDATNRESDTSGLQRSEGAVTLTRRPLTSQDSARAMHPAYTEYSIRLDSFLKSSEWKSANVSEKSLAESGFLFAGFGDNVRCHFCDGGLRNWEKDDNPWVEHARWFPRCGYLINTKGQGFIDDVQVKFPVRKEPREEQPLASDLDPLDKVPLNVVFRKEARDMGFTNDQIKGAVEKQQQDKGHTFLDLQSLVHALIALMPETEVPASGATGNPRAKSSGRQNSPTSNRKEQEEEKPGTTTNQPKSKKTKKKKKKSNPGGGESNQQVTQAPASSVPTTVVIPEDDEESRSLMEENRQLKEQRMCKVCMDEEVNIVFLPCGHLVSCASCAPALRACPICRALIRGSLRTYLS